MQKRKAPHETVDSVPVSGDPSQEVVDTVGENSNGNETEHQACELSRADCLGLFNQGKYSGDAACFFHCVEGCKGLLRKYPGDADIRRLCARSNVQLGILCEEDAQAATFFRKAIAADRSLADAHSNLGLRIRDEDAAAAEHHFREAIQLAAAVLNDCTAGGGDGGGGECAAEHLSATQARRKDTDAQEENGGHTLAIESANNENSKNDDNDGDIEEEEEEEEEEDEVEEEMSSFEQEELDAGRVAQYNLALLLSQLGGRDSEADAHCRALSFNYRLSPEVLAHARGRKKQRQQRGGDPGASPLLPQQTSGPPGVPEKSASDKHLFVRTHEAAIRPALLRQLQRNFSPDAPFWDEHGYHEEPGFFSYNYPLSSPPSNAVEVLIQSLRPVLEKDLADGLCNHSSERSRCAQSEKGSSSTTNGAAGPNSIPEIVSAEWWVHSRAHGSGHQLHYDMDEARLRTSGGKDRGHPLVSTILYLSHGAAPEEQPTLVTQQRFAGVGGYASTNKSSRATASKESQYEKTGGWLVYPRENRLCFFDGELLHGVVPGTPGAARKVASAGGSADIDADHPEQKRARHQGGSEETNSELTAPVRAAPPPCGGLRTTLMIGWWARDPVKTPAGQLGPNMVAPLPVPVFDDDAPEADDAADNSVSPPSDISAAGSIEQRDQVARENPEEGEVEQETIGGEIEQEHSDEELKDFEFRTRAPQWPTELTPTEEVLQEFKASPSPQGGDAAGDVSASAAACMDVSRVWRSLHATSPSQALSGLQNVPVFPATNGVMFFGRLFLQSLNQVDEEIMAGYDDAVGTPVQ